jgi:hypothetical protein
MTNARIDRRQFLLATTALGGAAASVVITAPALESCAALHARVTAELGTMARSAAFAAGNVRSMVMDIVCPCCGQPLFDFG